MKSIAVFMKSVVVFVKSGSFHEKHCGFHLKSEKHNEKHQNSQFNTDLSFGPGVS